MPVTFPKSRVRTYTVVHLPKLLVQQLTPNMLKVLYPQKRTVSQQQEPLNLKKNSSAACTDKPSLVKLRTLPTPVNSSMLNSKVLKFKKSRRSWTFPQLATRVTRLFIRNRLLKFNTAKTPSLMLTPYVPASRPLTCVKTRSSRRCQMASKSPWSQLRLAKRKVFLTTPKLESLSLATKATVWAIRARISTERHLGTVQSSQRWFNAWHSERLAAIGFAISESYTLFLTTNN